MFLPARTCAGDDRLLERYHASTMLEEEDDEPSETRGWRGERISSGCFDIVGRREYKGLHTV